MVQKEVAERFLADPGSKKYGLTTLNLALCARGRKIMEVKPGAFKPEPKVMSTVISLVLTEQYHYPLVSETVFRTLTGIAFRQRRKMLRNTLIPFFVSNGITKQQALDILLSAGIDPKSRPESVDVSDFVKICNAFATQHSGSTAAESRQ